jgi:hypothetical protein
MPFQQRSRDGTHGRCTARPVTAKCRNLCIPHAILEGKRTWETYARKSTARTLKPGRLRARSFRPFLPALPKSGGLPLLTRLQNRACAFPFTRLLSDAAPVMSTIPLTGLGDALSALHTYLGQAGFMSSACLFVPLPSTPPLPRQRILGIAPGLGFLGDPTSGPGVRLTTCSRGHPREPV